jgi:single-strand DNA-binding protein
MANLNFNKAILGGRLTADVEMKQTPSGVSVCTFSIAVNRKVGKDAEQKTDFINCVAWRNTAEFISKYFKKGSCILVVGNIQNRSWQDNNGNKRYATEVIVDEVNFVDSKGESNGPIGGGATPYSADATAFEEMTADDDLPFN